MITRRKFIQNMAVGAAGMVAANSIVACAGPTERKLENFGFISGILNPNFREGDWQAILQQTADFGYTEIEIGNFMGDSLPAFKSFLMNIGLTPVAGGTRFQEDMDEVNKSLDFHNLMDMKYAIVYWPYFTSPPFGLEHCKKGVEVLNKMGEVCKSRGITLCWHNHDHEFVPMEEGLPFDYFMQQTEQDLVQCQLDIYWAQKGGVDPVETLQKYPGRYPMLHIKDMAPGEDQDFACPGEGIIDWPAVFSEAHEQGIKHFSVERDGAVDGLECLRVSAAYLKELRF